MLAAAFPLLLMAAPPKVPAKPPAANPAVAAAPVAGGYSAVDRHAPELHAPLKAAVTVITPAKHPGAKLLAAQRQVVAGTNYRLTLQLRDGSRWQATVWHKLDGTDQVTETTRLD